jgi:branched-subunit amino acid aminotransferase/4-amino-4-deoxychorismate lyase
VSSHPLAVAVTGRGLVDPDEPVLAAHDEGFLRGQAAFETLRVYAGRPFRLPEHLARIERSAGTLGLPAPAVEELTKLAMLALEHSGARDAVLRLYWTPGPAGDGPPLGLALVSEIPGWIEEARARGQRLIALLYPRRSTPWLLAGTKSTSYAVHLAAEAEAQRRGGEDAVFVDAEGIVLEGPVTNVWWRRGGTLETPSLDLGILAGETRAALLELAPGLGYEVAEGSYELDRLLGADEAFTSSSVREVLPVVSVDGRALGRGPAADELQAALRQAATTTL